MFTITLPNINYGDQMPEEDYFLVNKNNFCVADGITRDPKSPAVFSFDRMEKFIKNYPNPSPAAIAARSFCEKFIESLGKGLSVKSSFIAGNKKIAEINKKKIKEVDYLVNDFYGCVASGGQIKGNVLYWGAVTDCGIIIYNKKGKIKFQTPDWMKNFDNYIRRQKIDWSQPEARRMVRKEYRNNQNKIFRGKCVSYGALTGEEQAESFMHFGKELLDDGDMVVFYSDGFMDTVSMPGFYKAMMGKRKFGDGLKAFSESLAKEDREKYGRERTLIAKIYNS